MPRSSLYLGRRRPAVLFCAAALAAAVVFVLVRSHYRGAEDVPVVLRRSGPTMNTLATIAVEAPRETGEEVLDAAFALLDTLEGALSRYAASSDISNVNRSSGVSAVGVGGETAAVLAVALEIAEATGGCFDPTVGPLTDLWRILAKDENWRFPSEERVSAARALVDYRELSLTSPASPDEAGGGDEEAALVRLNLKGAALDLAGIAKGYAADRIAAALCKERGVRSAMIDLGGNLTVLGPRMGEISRTEGSSWRLGIRNPLKSRDAKDEGSVACALEFGLAPGETMSVSTSGSYERFREADGRRLSHVFDPRTGLPVETSLLSVSVIDPCSARADALATAFLAMGEEKARELLSARFPSTEAVFLRRGDGGSNENITVSLTQGLWKRLKYTAPGFTAAQEARL